jgi:hypothetical protein
MLLATRAHNLPSGAHTSAFLVYVIHLPAVTFPVACKQLDGKEHITLLH